MPVTHPPTSKFIDVPIYRTRAHRSVAEAAISVSISAREISAHAGKLHGSREANKARNRLCTPDAARAVTRKATIDLESRRRKARREEGEARRAASSLPTASP